MGGAQRKTVQIITVSTVISKQDPTARTPLTFGFPQVFSSASVGRPVKNQLDVAAREAAGAGTGRHKCTPVCAEPLLLKGNTSG